MVKLKTEEYFYTCNGEVLKTKNQLVKFLKKVDDTVFSYHVNDYKNDFANWIKDVFKEEELFDQILSLKNPLDMAFKIQESTKPKTKRDKENIIGQIKEAING